MLRKGIKILGKVLSAIVLLLVMLPVLAALLLDIPAVQNMVVHKAAQQISRRLGTTVRIGRVDIGLFSRVRIEELYVEDFQHDTLLYAGRLDASFSALGLFGGGIVMSEGVLQNARFCLRETPEGEMNVKQLVDRLVRRKGDGSGKFRLTMERLRAEGLDVAGLTSREQEVVGQMNYIEDATIEIDALAELPDDYVRQPAEKLRLYRELDSTRDEEALVRFEARLADRFGALPGPARELLNVVRLRWEAVRLGMERVKVRNGLMIVHFVGDESSPYYKSETFMQLLQRVAADPSRFVLKQHNNRLAMTVRQIKDIEEAYRVLRSL